MELLQVLGIFCLYLNKKCYQCPREIADQGKAILFRSTMVCSGTVCISGVQRDICLGDGRLPAMQQSSAAQYAQCLQLRAYTFGGRPWEGRHITIIHIPTYDISWKIFCMLMLKVFLLIRQYLYAGFSRCIVSKYTGRLVNYLLLITQEMPPNVALNLVRGMEKSENSL